MTSKRIKDRIKYLKITFLLLLLIAATNYFSSSIYNENITEDVSFNKNTDVPILPSAATASWWNASFRYRVEINLKEPGNFNRTFEPVDVFQSFDASKCNINTIRVVENNLNEISYQLWNETMYDATYIKSCTITFLATVEQNKNNSYYIYYSDNDDNGNILNPNQGYIDESGFSSVLQGTSLNINTTEFALKLEEGKGIYNFSRKGYNYHTTNSLAPWIKNGAADDTVFTPDSTYGGSIYSWLAVGPFNYFNPDWANAVTSTNYHFDVTKQYIAGDRATGGSAPSQFLDTSKKFTFRNFKDFTTYASTNGYNDLNYHFGGVNSGAPEYACGYALCYIKSPVALSSAYLKVGSDDGIKIFRDGQVIHYNHVLRGPGPDRDLVGPLTFEANRWYCFIVLVEDNTGQFGFHFRFSNNSVLYPSSPGSDPAKITNLQVMMRPPFPVIQTISEVENGPIFSKYDLTWQDTGDMKVWDTITVYNNYNAWKIKRSLWWASNQINTTFSVLNTRYQNVNSVFDDYFYDNTWKVGMSSPSFVVSNYSVVRDRTAPLKDLVSLGIFITDIKEGNQYMTLNKLKWALNYNGTMVSMRPGNVTDLLNNGPHIWPSDSDYNVEITLWEYLDDKIGDASQYIKANTTFVGIFNALKHPLIKTGYVEESSIFDLIVITKDLDGFAVNGVTINIYNKSNSVEIRNNQTTSVDGSTTFLRLPKANYTLNFTYQKYSQPRFVVKSNYYVSLNETKTISVDGLSLTSLDLELVREGAISDKIKGAEVEFWYVNSSGKREYKIGTESSDSFGKVLFVWKNSSSTQANISVNVNVLGQNRLLNLTSYYLNYTIVSRTNDTIRVQVDQYQTGLEKIEPSTSPITNKYRGESINLKFRYYWYNESTPTQQANITSASITYSIKRTSTGEIIGTGLFNLDIYPIGFYNITIDTNDLILNLIAGVDYQIDILAQKPGYEEKISSINFNLKEILTNLTAENDNFILPWNSLFTVRVFYNDSLHAGIGINDSIVTYSVPGRVSGSFVEETEDGWYNITLNSTVFILKGDYYMSISAFKENYQFRDKLINITITEIHTQLIANVSSITKIWNEIFSLSVKFNDTDNNRLLTGATITYSALGTINPVEGSLQYVSNGNYTFTLNTTAFLYADTYFLRLTAVKLNYESKIINIPLEILPIPTIINSSFSIIDTYDVFVGTKHILYFNYQTVSGIGIAEATATYQWQKRGGIFIPGVLQNISTVGVYALDFNTELKVLGTYSLIISLEKLNHETRSATIILNIIEREMDISLSDNFKDDQINVKQGESFAIEIELRDPTSGLNEKLTGAKVILTIGEVEFKFKEVKDGVYQYEFSTKEYEAFFTSQTITGKISISASNFTSQEQTITIVVEMKEIFPGIPTFYFILGAIAFIGVVGSLVTYKVIQSAKIPKFVKKIRSIKKTIQNRKNISESLLYSSKLEEIKKQFGESWDVIGASIDDSLQIKKSKTLSEASLKERERGEM